MSDRKDLLIRLSEEEIVEIGYSTQNPCIGARYPEEGESGKVILNINTWYIGDTISGYYEYHDKSRACYNYFHNGNAATVNTFDKGYFKVIIGVCEDSSRWSCF